MQHIHSSESVRPLDIRGCITLGDHTRYIHHMTENVNTCVWRVDGMSFRFSGNLLGAKTLWELHKIVRQFKYDYRQGDLMHWRTRVHILLGDVCIVVNHLR